jgi:hypothetical protein
LSLRLSAGLTDRYGMPEDTPSRVIKTDRYGIPIGDPIHERILE